MRNKKFLVLTIFVFLCACAYIFRNNFGTYQIVEVYDGDTIAVDMEGVIEKVRMIGADTPETVDPRKPVQCFGKEASDYTHSHLVKGMRVRLVADPINSDRDRYNRLLRYVYLQDGSLYNQKIIELGYARAYTGFPFTKLSDFKSTQASAQASQTGLWAQCSEG